MNKEFYFLFIGKKENKVFKIKLEVYQLFDKQKYFGVVCYGEVI